MHSTHRVSGTLRWTSTILTTVSILAGAALTYRIWKASAFGILEAFTSLGTAILIVGAVSGGWAIHVRKLRARAEHAEWEAARLRRQETLLDGDEDRALWDSTPAAKSSNGEDTCAFGTGVVVLNQYRRQWGQQAG